MRTTKGMVGEWRFSGLPGLGSEGRDASFTSPYKPVLDREPDGRKAWAPVFNPVLFGYVALMLGASVAALCATYNAFVLRRIRLAISAVAVGVFAWLGFLFTVTYLYRGGASSIPLALLAGRLVHLAFGILLAGTQWAHVRGNRLLGGRVIPLLACVLVAFAVTFFLSGRIQLLLMGLPVRGR